jgi:uncharacterized membrane protein YidH (DUF202 family)
MTSRKVNPAPLLQSIGILLVIVGVVAYVMGRLPFFEAAQYWETLDIYSYAVLVLGAICLVLWAVLRRR